MIKYNCYFAGNSKPIEGGGKMKYGIIIESDGNIFKDSKEFPPDIRNNINVAEVMGLTRILKMLQKKESSEINIYGDSMLVMNQINGNFMHTNDITDNVKTLLNELSKKNIINVFPITKDENKDANDLAIFEEDMVEAPTKYEVLGNGNLTAVNIGNEDYLSIFVDIKIPLNLFKNLGDNFINVVDSEVNKVKYLVNETLLNNKEIGVDFSKNKERFKIPTGGIAENKSSNLWLLFMRLTEKALKNRDEFFEIITNDSFSEEETKNIENLNMFNFYYDEDKYVFRFK